MNMLSVLWVLKSCEVYEFIGGGFLLWRIIED